MIYGVAPTFERARLWIGVDRDEDAPAADVGVAHAIGEFIRREIEAGEVACIRLVAVAGVHAVGPAVDRSL